MTETPMPANVDAERLVLGSILVDNSLYPATVSVLDSNDFFLEKHRRIFSAMAAISVEGDHIDRVNIAERLMRSGELDSVDGFTYLASLDEGLPKIENIDGYVRIVKDKAKLRRLIGISRDLKDRCARGDDPTDILNAAEESLLGLGPGKIEGCGELGCRCTDLSLPPSLRKAIHDPFDYALGLSNKTVIRFNEVMIEGDWAHVLLTGHRTFASDDIPYECPRGVDVKLSEIVWCADAPEGS